jgi:hypothetical protein
MIKTTLQVVNILFLFYSQDTHRSVSVPFLFISKHTLIISLLSFSHTQSLEKPPLINNFTLLANHIGNWGSVVVKALRSPPKDCMTLTLVVGLAWSSESWSYAGCSVATGRVSHARLVCDEDPD